MLILQFFDNRLLVCKSILRKQRTLHKQSAVNGMFLLCVRSVLSVGVLHWYMDDWIRSQWNSSVSSDLSTGNAWRLPLVYRSRIPSVAIVNYIRRPRPDHFLLLLYHGVAMLCVCAGLCVRLAGLLYHV